MATSKSDYTPAWEARLFAEGWATTKRVAAALGLSVTSVYSLTKKADDHPTGNRKMKRRQRVVLGKTAVLRVRYFARHHLISVRDVKRHFKVDVPAPAPWNPEVAAASA